MTVTMRTHSHPFAHKFVTKARLLQPERTGAYTYDMRSTTDRPIINPLANNVCPLKHNCYMATPYALQAMPDTPTRHMLP
jgi:hypothetical protein